MRLTIELVPSSSWLNNVRAILTSTQWDAIKKQVYSQAWYTCQICGGTGDKHPVECHEIWKYNDKKLIQKLVGMIALCPNCHMVKHIGLAQLNGKLDFALKHFIKVNKISKKSAISYLQKSFKKWNERSTKKWKLDISILETYGIDTSKIKENEYTKQ